MAEQLQNPQPTNNRCPFLVLLMSNLGPGPRIFPSSGPQFLLSFISIIFLAYNLQESAKGTHYAQP